ncbi:MAG TPA: nucleoside triphosphate pyrophosphohydrolase [Clostridiaceae bacterium]
MVVYDKLVRDKIPGKIKALGNDYSIRYCPEEEISLTLKNKLMEEVKLLISSSSCEEIEDRFADIMEVIYTLAEKSGLCADDLQKKRLSMKEEHGGFREGIILEYY